MKHVTYSRAAKALADQILLKAADVSEGRMFGYPAYFVGRSMIACHYGGAIGIKVRQPFAEELVRAGRVSPFEPHGRARMREWVQITVRNAKSLQAARDIFQAAIEYARCREANR